MARQTAVTRHHAEARPPRRLRAACDAFIARGREGPGVFRATPKTSART
ncbi:hypothetical protein ACIBO5_57070 [Nonomuraea angiospora]|nr:hypothetical protein [Nonomuraea angiospora]MDX3110457.1 hypothetical protein [Nonomuraea angiospora]